MHYVCLYMQLHYEGAVTIKKLTTVDTFALSDETLRARWASVILAFVFSSDGFEIPQDWFSAELKPKTSERTAFRTYHDRLHKVIVRMPEATFRTNVLGCLKVLCNLLITRAPWLIALIHIV